MAAATTVSVRRPLGRANVQRAQKHQVTKLNSLLMVLYGTVFEMKDCLEAFLTPAAQLICFDHLLLVVVLLLLSTLHVYSKLQHSSHIRLQRLFNCRCL